MLVVVEFSRDLFQHFNVESWNEFVGELVRHGMVPVAWSKGERSPPVGVMLDFRGLRRAHYKLDGIDLTFCDLEGANFEGASLKGAKLGPCPGANLRGARLQGAAFRGDVSGADFTGAELHDTDFRDATYDPGKPPVGLPGEALANCKPEPENATDDAEVQSVPADQPLRATVTISEVPW
jgi:uncharacterized protein YjbI with pentapeptide repeats